MVGWLWIKINLELLLQTLDFKMCDQLSHRTESRDAIASKNKLTSVMSLSMSYFIGDNDSSNDSEIRKAGKVKDNDYYKSSTYWWVTWDSNMQNEAARERRCQRSRSIPEQGVLVHGHSEEIMDADF